MSECSIRDDLGPWKPVMDSYAETSILPANQEAMLAKGSCQLKKKLRHMVNMGRKFAEKFLQIPRFGMDGRPPPLIR